MEFLETTLWNSTLRLPRSWIQGTHASCNMGYVWFQGPYVFFVSSSARVVLLQIDLTKWYGLVMYPSAMQCSMAPWSWTLGMIFAVASLNKHWGEVVALFLMSHRPTGSRGGVTRACGYNFTNHGSWTATRNFAAIKAKEKEEAITYRSLRLTIPFVISCQSCAPPHRDQWPTASAQGHRQMIVEEQPSLSSRHDSVS